MARIRDWIKLDLDAQCRRRDVARAHAAAVSSVTNAFVEIVPPTAPCSDRPLSNLPYTAKDMFRIPSREPGCGFGPGFAAGIEGFSEPIERLADCGADLIGFTGMTELAYEPSGFNATCGRVRNPWNFDYIAGGSSSGSAAAVASGAVVAALGSDTGGSIRISAHACGITGWKPSYGLISALGAMPLAPSLDTIGLLARSAEDILLVAFLVASPNAAALPRCAVVPDDVVAQCEPVIRRSVADAVAAIEAAGVKIERRSALPTVEEIDRHALIIMQGESARQHRRWLEGDTLAPALRKRLAKGLEIGDDAVAASIAARSALARAFDDQVFAGGDVVVMPVMPIATPTAERCNPASDRFSARTLYALSRWTRFVNMLGLPAVAMPAGFDDNGMPIGVQLVGKTHADLALLSLARKVQAVTDWHARVPAAVADLLPDGAA